MSPLPTLDQHLRSEGVAPELAVVIDRFASAGREIARELARAALVGQLGTTGATNVQGESVKKLDAWANDLVLGHLEATGSVGVAVSEEMDQPLLVNERGHLVVCFDPVDGSSNLDVNGIVGTIFSIRRRLHTGRGGMLQDALLPGTAQVAAGYVMYGPSTVLVTSTGRRLDAFTHDPDTGEFRLSHPQIRLPKRGRTYSVNDSKTPVWQPGVRELVEYLRERDRETGRPYTARYVGSMVADVHRTILEGGIFMYPAETGEAARGKLRLQYEAAPMAYLVETAGGRASTGIERILSLTPSTPHERAPIFIGSESDVVLAETFLRRHA